MRTLNKMWHSAGRQKPLGSPAGATYIVMMVIMMILIGFAVTVRDSAVVTGVLSDDKAVAGNHLLDNGDAARSTTGHFAFSSGLSKKKQQVKRFSAYFSALARERRAVSSPKAEKSSYVPVDNLSSADLFIAVKTTGKYHRTRLELLLNTWISRNTQQTYIFTDAEDEQLRKRMGGHLINSNCSSAHSRQALSCKMALEYSAFIASGNKWFCHVDDDNYVNVRPLVRLLSHYNHRDDLYVGRPSLDRPIEATERLSPSQAKPVRFWFATGGAGFCISRGLALKMARWASGGKFMSTAERIRLPDDCTVGYIIEGLLGVRLVRSPLFHSHLESLGLVSDIYNQVTLSYSMVESQRNTVSLRGVFSLEDDPTRFRSVHCLLYPDTPWCPS